MATVVGRPVVSTMRRPLWVAAAVVVLVAIIGSSLLLTHWPYRESAVIPKIEDCFDAQVTVQHFERVYLPHPGLVARGVTMRRSTAPGVPPLAVADRLVMRFAYIDLLFAPHRIRFVGIDGLLVRIPPAGTGHPVPRQANNSGSSPSEVSVDTISISPAKLHISAHPPGPSSLDFDIHQLTLHRVSEVKPFDFAVSMRNALPPGEIQASGSIGPFGHNGIGNLPVHGSYTLTRAALHAFPPLDGTLSSQGKFQGSLQHLDIDSAVDAPDFHLTGRHPSRITVNLHALVNGTNGDTQLDPIQARVNQTSIASEAKVAGTPEKIDVTFDVKDGRIQDLLGLFVHDKSPLDGTVSLHASGNAPGDGKDFLRRLYLAGDFGSNRDRFTNPKSQQNVNLLSQRAEGQKSSNKAADNQQEAADAPPVVSDLGGHVVLQDGIAHFTGLSFSVPGASAHMHGTYNLLDQRFNLRGTMRMEASLSQSTRGIKSLLLKPLGPFFKHKKATVVPVVLIGTYDHPNFSTDLF